MPTLKKLLLASALSFTLSACDDDTVEIVEVEREVVVQNTVTVVETVEVPTIVEVPAGAADNVELGSRPFFLVNDMDDSSLKAELQQCSEGPFYKTDFSIGHRGAPLQYPEHTKESYEAAARMGAGILECDVTFTQDKELVCRHSQCDLHTTTNILATDLASKCSVPFTPADPANGVLANAQCCTSDITLAEFKTLKGKMDAANRNASNVEDYLNGTADWRTDLYDSKGTLLTHAESIALFKQLKTKMTPELKTPAVTMPFDGFTQQDYAQKMIDEYKGAGVDATDVFPQSFNLDDIQYWLANEPAFGTQAVYLDDRYATQLVNNEQGVTASELVNNPERLVPSMAELAESGVQIIAPPIWVLVTVENGTIVPSAYALAAREAGLDIIAWSLERSGQLGNGGGWYFQSVNGSLGTEAMINNDGDVMTVLNVLANDVGVLGVFSDWPATTSYYASCMRMPPSL
jgi:glycerophosphoryl diester phosphodiesterase